MKTLSKVLAVGGLLLALAGFILWKLLSRSVSEAEAELAYEKNLWDWQELRKRYAKEIAEREAKLVAEKRDEIVKRFHESFGS